MKPNGLMKAWQPVQRASAVTLSMRCALGARRASSGMVVSTSGGRHAERQAHHLAREEDAALDQARGGRARVRGDHRRLAEDAEALRGVEHELAVVGTASSPYRNADGAETSALVAFR